MSDLKERLKQDKSILETTLIYYGVNINTKGNSDCIDSRHKHSGKGDYTISYKNCWVGACGCGLCGDVFKIVEIMENITDFKEQIKRVCEICSINQDVEYKPIKQDIPINRTEKKTYDFTVIADELHKNVINTDYFQNRGLTSTINKYKLGYHPEGLNFIINNFPGVLEEKANDLYATYQYFIPCFNEDNVCTYILARRNDNLSIPEWVTFKVNKTHNLKGYAASLFNVRYLYHPQLTKDHIFCVESWADALSLEELGYYAIALNSTSNVNIFLNHVKKNKDLLKKKIFITAGNTDTAGYEMNNNISKGLKALGLQCHTYIITQYNDINEHLTNDREELKANINDFISSLIVEKRVVEVDKPIPFDNYDNLMDFPKECLIDWQKDFVEAVAESTQTPADLGAVISLSAIATAVQGKYIVQGYQDWNEPLNIYTLSIMKPSERKSPVYSHIVKPIFEYENTENERLKPEIEKSRTEKKILEDMKNCQEKAASNPKGTNQHEAKTRALQLAEEISEFKELKPLHLIADDITAERTATLLAENEGRLSILSAEGTLFSIITGRYSSNGSNNFEVYLKGYSADEIRVDRQRQTPIYISNPALTIGITSQPDVLNGLMQNSELKGRGLTARFLYSVPKSFVGKRKINPQVIPEHIKIKYSDSIKTLLNIEIPETPNTIKLSIEAKAVFDSFREELEPRLIDDLASISEWCGKLSGNILRIAGLLYLASRVNDDNPWLWNGEHEISLTIMNKAINIGKYFLNHAIGSFGMMGTDADTENAKVLLKWLDKTDTKEFKKYDAYRTLRYRCSKTEDVDPALQILIERNYIELQEVPHAGVGRKPEGIYKKIN